MAEPLLSRASTDLIPISTTFVDVHAPTSIRENLLSDHAIHKERRISTESKEYLIVYSVKVFQILYGKISTCRTLIVMVPLVGHVKFNECMYCSAKMHVLLRGDILSNVFF